MIEPMPQSPSSLKLYSDCPRRYQNRYITKEFPSEFGAAAERGTVIHALLERTLKGEYMDGPLRVEVSKGRFVTGSWNEYQKEWENCKDLVSNIHEFMEDGWDIFVERELATTSTGASCGWWDKNCYMRAKIDVLMVNPDKTQILILDWKTGKSKYINEFQLPFIGLVLIPYYGCRIYGAMDFMIDQGDAIRSTVNIVRPLPKYMRNKTCESVDIRLVIETLRKLNEAHINNSWPCVPNGLCRFCEVATCIHKK